MHIEADIENVIVFLDDILIFAESPQELNRLTEKVLRRLRKMNVLINIKKCVFGVKQIDFLGHAVNCHGIHIAEDKLKELKAFKCPTTKEEASGFLGFAAFLCHHIQNFSDLAKLIREFIHGKAEKWESAQTDAFHTIICNLIRNRNLISHFNPNRKSYLFMDASPTAIGAVLVQVLKNQKFFISHRDEILAK